MRGVCRQCCESKKRRTKDAKQVEIVKRIQTIVSKICIIYNNMVEREKHFLARKIVINILC